MAEAPQQTTSSSIPALGWTGAESPEKAEAYRPLSLLAVAGFSLAVLYAGLVTLGGLAAFYSRYPGLLALLAVGGVVAGVMAAVLTKTREPDRVAAFAGLGLAGVLAIVGMAGVVAFSSSSPWLLSMWTLALPIGAAVLCWVARLRVQSSEGTLGGLQLARWGMSLSLVFGLLYFAYLASTFLAVRTQATDFVAGWMDRMKKGELDRAYLDLIPSQSRPDEGPGLREAIEVKFNTPVSPTEPGMFSQFQQNTYVRLIQLGGDDTTFQLENFSWSQDKQAYVAEMRYQVTTPHVTFPLLVKVRGLEPLPGEKATGRQWHIVPEGTRLLQDPKPVGEDTGLLEVPRAAIQMVHRFLDKLHTRNLSEAYLDTLPSAERARQAEAKTLADIPWLPPLGDARDTAAYEKGLARFLRGNNVIADENTFWCDPDFRNEIVADAKQCFNPEMVFPPQIQFKPSTFPLIRKVNGKLQVCLDVVLPLGTPRGMKYLLSAAVVVESDSKDMPPPRNSWRVVGLELLRGHTPPKPPNMPAPGAMEGMQQPPR
jgi:hypothetical protein